MPVQVCHSERSEESALEMDRRYYVYILASRSRNLYTGVTNNLIRRVYEHKQGLVEAFTRRYRIHRLVHFEVFAYVREAIAQEKEIKAWRREKKISLIESRNPAWDDLASEWNGEAGKGRADPSLRSG